MNLNDPPVLYTASGTLDIECRAYRGGELIDAEEIELALGRAAALFRAWKFMDGRTDPFTAERNLESDARKRRMLASLLRGELWKLAKDCSKLAYHPESCEVPPDIIQWGAEYFATMNEAAEARFRRDLEEQHEWSLVSE